MPSRIEDYALIGDCHTAALVARDGSIDWLCLPRFDSPACFAALLGTTGARPLADRSGGRGQAQSRAATARTRWCSKPTFETERAPSTVIDCMPPRQHFARRAAARRGRARPGRRCGWSWSIRFDYGSIVPWVRAHRRRHLRAIAGPDMLRSAHGVALRGEDLKTTAEFTVSEGQQSPFALAGTRRTDDPPAQLDVERSASRRPRRWWREWAGRCTYQGQWREAVLRSLITLKALTYAPTGGIVAAPTTSLPEKLGGVRNWDYRYLLAARRHASRCCRC